MKTLAGKVLSLPIAVGNWLILAVGFAGAVTWFIGKGVEVRPSDPWQALLASWLAFISRVTLVCLLFGGLALFFAKVKSRNLAGSLGRGVAASRAWLVFVILAVQGILAAAFAHPLIALFGENLQILQRWGIGESLNKGGEFSGIALVPALGILLVPGLAALTAAAFISGATASLGYLVLGLEQCPRMLLRSLCVQIAFLLSLFFAHALLESGARMASERFTGLDSLEFRAQVLHWLAGQTAVVALMVERLAWLLPGLFLCAAMMLREARQEDEQPALDEIESEKASMENSIREPFPERVPVGERTGAAWTDDPVEAADEFDDKSYYLRWKFLSNPFYKVLGLYDSDDRLVFVARMSGLSFLTRVIELHTAGNEQTKTLTLTGNRFFLFPKSFDMTCHSDGRRMGTFKSTPAGWVILGGDGRQLAVMKMEESTWGSVRFHVLMGRSCVCRYMFQRILRPVMTIDFPEDSVAVFDRKLGIGLALILCFQSVQWDSSGD